MGKEIDTAAIDTLIEELVATREMPVDTTASRWIAEAEAVAKDLEMTQADDQVLRRRLTHVKELIDNIEETDNPAVDEHLENAMDVLERVLS